MTPVGFEGKVGFAWKVADKLRGSPMQHEDGAMLLLPRPIDAVFATARGAVRAMASTFTDLTKGTDAILKKAACDPFRWEAV